jgi:hypothetical protein
MYLAVTGRRHHSAQIRPETFHTQPPGELVYPRDTGGLALPPLYLTRYMLRGCQRASLAGLGCCGEPPRWPKAADPPAIAPNPDAAEHPPQRSQHVSGRAWAPVCCAMSVHCVL